MNQSIQTQIEYIYRDGAHWWYGRDRLCQNVIIANKDLRASLVDLKKAVREAITSHDATGTVSCKATDEEIIKHAEKNPNFFLWFDINNFNM